MSQYNSIFPHIYSDNLEQQVYRLNQAVTTFDKLQFYQKNINFVNVARSLPLQKKYLREYGAFVRQFESNNLQCTVNKFFSKYMLFDPELFEAISWNKITIMSLRELDFSHGAFEQFIQGITQKCPFLQFLDLSHNRFIKGFNQNNAPDAGSSKPAVFTNLKTLILNNLPRLTAVDIQCQQLKYCSLSGCAQLLHVLVDSPALKQLDLYNSSKVADDQLVLFGLAGIRLNLEAAQRDRLHNPQLSAQE